MKRTSGALMTSVVLHLVIAFVAGIYLVTQTERFKDLIGIEVLQPEEAPKPMIGRSLVKPADKPTIPTRKIVIEQIQVPPRLDTVFLREPTF